MVEKLPLVGGPGILPAAALLITIEKKRTGSAVLTRLRRQT